MHLSGMGSGSNTYAVLQVVERHNKPEVEVGWVVSSHLSDNCTANVSQRLKRGLAESFNHFSKRERAGPHRTIREFDSAEHQDQAS